MNLYTPRAALFCIRYWNMLLDAVNTSGVTRNDDLITCLKLGPDASEKRVVDMSWSVLKAPFSHNCSLGHFSHRRGMAGRRGS